ncbi:MOSC domain-containing protein [Sulfitobacter donghicola]|uniref:Molybdenum cofactor biosysynthesis protein n=1 Tax=Sulfitobacter donghicola DSW-25 = KCTC 12864 = JCM 14565 TaxID=1300350 RepID=A0A073IGN8_9RHOB|nr:MOSC N-terminal beta barrel domain-containing protein [Sulfitobacter donghicola]KEJ88666.1 molybdenum cofactor biosysynthesis protein [Sulfitobacter donghicola DSW-25 = KCTC 12864 = JCM 14565]KIN68434.1 MOSC domain protein [Sulfitobacter donghicola DSW-25 = KCTC 12864 = JCM 14565]
MQITALWRHPLKAHGREALDEVTLIADASMPYDRTWAVAHKGAKAVAGEWARCVNFTRAAAMPQLQAITASLDETSELLTLRHPDRPDLTFHPDHGAEVFLDWVAPLCPPERAQPDQIMRIGPRGYTDSDVPSISLMNVASHLAVEQAANASLAQERWRGNVWFDGTEPWMEFDFVGKTLKLGEATVQVDATIERCKSIMANTKTGERDHDLLSVLRGFDHQNFGVCFSVITGGKIRLGDKLELI